MNFVISMNKSYSCDEPCRPFVYTFITLLILLLNSFYFRWNSSFFYLCFAWAVDTVFQ